MNDFSSNFDLESNRRLARFAIINVLLIDDQTIVAEAIRRMLADEKDIRFHFCKDAANAIPDALNIDATVVLLDLVMPDVDGLTLVRYFRANKATVDLPIIVMSSKEDPTIKQQAFTNGANDYIVKLPDRIELIARIRAQARQYQLQQERDMAIMALRDMQRQLEQTNSELQRLSSLDPLTGISNRRVFDDKLNHEWNRARRECTPLTLILADVDYFKFYNDHYGHQQGDTCLTRVALALKGMINRPGDIVARYGGEEFGIILPDTDNAGAQMMAGKFQQAIVKLAIAHKNSRSGEIVTISQGAATFIPTGEQTLTMLLGKADNALYEAKNSGRNRAVISGPLGSESN